MAGAPFIEFFLQAAPRTTSGDATDGRYGHFLPPLSSATRDCSRLVSGPTGVDEPDNRSMALSSLPYLGVCRRSEVNRTHSRRRGIDATDPKRSSSWSWGWILRHGKGRHSAGVVPDLT